MREFRFGFQIRKQTADELRATARRVEDAGFAVISSWDHVVDGWAPLSPLLAMADCTSRLRICPLVLNNDFHHPVHLARELASIDQLTGGRLEVGVGAEQTAQQFINGKAPRRCYFRGMRHRRRPPPAQTRSQR